MLRITPNLWFDTESQEAAEFYVSVFPNSRIRNVLHYTEAGPREAGMVMVVDFVLDGQDVSAINGGPEFSFSEAISLLVNCEDQAEVDYYWEKLGDGGEHGPCGWLKDRYGVSWQISPTAQMEELLGDSDAARASRAMAAMRGMQKLDIAALRAAADDA
jgi:predicted 3-demethylubiquinone-9 3-methyltransferase (glyoxalase superfamily)